MHVYYCKYKSMKLSFRLVVRHSEPRYTYPAAYKTTDDLLHLILKNDNSIETSLFKILLIASNQTNKSTFCFHV